MAAPTQTRLLTPSSTTPPPLQPPSPIIPSATLLRPTNNNLLLSLQTHGFAVLTNALPTSTLKPLRQHAQTALSLAQKGKWPHLRTVPKQFPPWTSDAAPGIWGLQHLLHPDMPGRLAFARCYFSDEVIGAVAQILEATDEDGDDGELVLELLNMLVAPPVDFQLRWHRDGVSFDGASFEQEARCMGLRPGSEEEVEGRRHKRASHAQYNIPLHPDDSLHIIPGSHLRPRTEEEAGRLEENVYSDEMPGAMIVSLQPGDVVFYDSNILHRGVYKAGRERLTLHGSVGEVGASREGGRATQVLQHGVGEWMGRCGFDGVGDGRIRVRAEGMRRRLLEAGKGREERATFVHKD
ncbi:MAG: hypothetical protein M1828_004219 [Chrysothrix sp. TS-e1954]|nr:MAG: hypothetical protein M1828_004219 [Chrysothrix sp. TS-e1954]